MEGAPFVKVPCILTGRLVPDTDRERIRQALAAHLLGEKGYRVEDFELDLEIEIEVRGVKLVSYVDLLARIEGRALMAVRCAPGSVVTRESGTVAAARLLLGEHIVPWAVQANLYDAALLDVRRKKALAYGWDRIPSRAELIEMTRDWPPPPLPPERAPLERQILYSYDTHG